MSLLGEFLDLLPAPRPGPPKRGVRVYFDALTRALRQVTSAGVDSAVGGGGGTTDHTALSNLGWTASGHTGTADRVAGFGPLGSPVYYQTGVDLQAYDAGLASLTSADASAGLPHVTAANTWTSLAPPSSNATEYVLGWVSSTTMGWVPAARGLMYVLGPYEAVAYGVTHYAGITGSLV